LRRLKSIKLEVTEIAADKISLLSIPFIQNPQEKNLVIGEARSSKFVDKVISGIDGSSYLVGLGKIEKIAQASDNKVLLDEQYKFLEESKKKAGERLNKILLEQLKLKVKPEIKSELLPK
jgi:hypothetical protein